VPGGAELRAITTAQLQRALDAKEFIFVRATAELLALAGAIPMWALQETRKAWQRR
jgi:hypothetical protein